MNDTPKPPADQNSDIRRLLMEQLFWGMLGPLIPNVILMVLIYNISALGIVLYLLILIYWLAVSGLVYFIVRERGRQNQIAGEQMLAFAGSLGGTALVVLFAHLSWTIFATFQEEPVNAFMFIFLINFLGTLGALLGYHNKRLLQLFK